MADSHTVHLSLVENSHAFMIEAVEKALQASEDVRQWQFAILHLVQSLELSLKSLLKTIHPVLIYQNIDEPRHTVSLRLALSRLENDQIGNVELLDKEKRKINSAIDLRNQITHSEFQLTSHYAQAKFFELFAFVAFFQSRHLNHELEEIISHDRISKIVEIEKSREELAEKALSRIKDEKIYEECLLECPNCFYKTFVISDCINTCYTCRHSELVIECPHCNRCLFEWEMESFADKLEYSCEEGGEEILQNNFGYSEYEACLNCLPNILEDIEEQKNDEYSKWMEDYYR